MLVAPNALSAHTRAPQGQVSLRLASAKGRQAPSAPPADWDAAVRELAGRIAAIAAPPARIDLTVNNLSSLGPDEAAAIGEQLQTELTKRRFRLSGAQPADASVTVTLSEGSDGYLLVAQVKRAANEKSDEGAQVAMVTVSKAAKKAQPSGGVSLEATRVWDQPGLILDFALPPPAAGQAPKLIVLERGRLVFYSRPQDQWQLDDSAIIPPARPWLRQARGHIDLSQGLTQGAAATPGIDCKGDFTNPQTIHCGFVSQDAQAWLQPDPAVPASLDLGGDAVSVGLACDGRPVVLASGKADWTQPDFVQAYEMDASGHAATLVGSPAQFAGPVTSLWATGASGGARAAVHNLKTGNYEAYAIAASCSH